MAEPTFESVFGASAVQDLSSITIAKSDLPGLTASASNTAESLLVGILLKVQTALSQTNFDLNLDQSIYVDNGFPNFAFR